jgi:hypothetical protein
MGACATVMCLPRSAALRIYYIYIHASLTGFAWYPAHKASDHATNRGAIYRAQPPARCWLFSERIKNFHRDGWIPTGNDGMIDFMWVVWEKDYVGKMQTWWI